MSKKKEVGLHLAKSFSELNAMIDTETTTGRDPKILIRSVPGIFKNAESSRENGDEERSYILYMRYYNTARKLQKSNIAKDKKYFDSMIKPKDIVTSIDWAEKLSESLGKRYELLKEEEEAAEKLKRLGWRDEKITDEPVASDVDSDPDQSMLNSFIKIESNGLKAAEMSQSADCQDLYNVLLNKNSNVLIMDVRSDTDFEISHIKSLQCINIPEHIIIPGITAPKLRTGIPEESKHLWDKRSNADIIYILDWYSSEEYMAPTVQHLKDAIFKWDTITTLKREPIILTGGYDKWLTYYPTMTTNSRVERPAKDGSESRMTIDLNFEYPNDLDEGFIMAPDAISSSDSSISSISVVSNISKQNTFKAMPNIDRTTKPKPEPVKEIVVTVKNTKPGKNTKPEVEWNDINGANTQPTKPTFNRTLKPKSVDRNQPKVEEMADERLEMWNQMSKYEKYVVDSLIMEKDKLQKETELKELRSRREKEAEETMRLDLQRQENELLNKICTLEENQKIQEAANKEISEENEVLKNRIKELTLEKDDEYKRLNDELLKNQKRESERRHLEKEVQKMRLERIKAEKFNENIKMEQPEHSIPKPRNLNTDRLPNTERNPLKTFNSTPIVNDISKGPKYAMLKDSNSSGQPSRFGKLSRAHSFHNISQITDSEEPLSNSSSFGERSIQALEAANRQHAIPLIDRNSKPSPKEISGAFSRNFMPVFGGLGSALTGLRNLGNTCYMNSVIQCLANTVSLVNFFRSGAYRDHVNRNGKYKGILVDEFAAIIQALYVGQYRSIAPRDFRNVISQYDKTFESCEQQDPQEFLNCVIDNLHEELKKAKSNQAAEAAANLSKSLDDSSLSDDEIAARSWAMYKMLHNSIITEMFQGQYRSTLKCLHCSKKAVKFDTFMFLSLPIPSGVNRCSLKDCLQLFIKEEKLTGGSKWKCPRCNELREAVKKIDIWKLPPVLLIHFKRFYYDGMWKGKMQTYIDFPVSEGLDLQTFVKGNESINVFSLYGVTNHSGTLDGGHCIAYCKNAENNRWYKYDDQEVREMSESDVKSSGAYILYYISGSGYNFKGK